MSGKKTEKAINKLPTVKEMLEAGVQFGHETKRWNPNFAEYIYTKRGKFHIIDLEKTLKMLSEAMKFLTDTSRKGKEVLIIGTKRQARDIVKEMAVRCGAHYVTNRWVGGLMTNFDVIQKSVARLREIEEDLSKDTKRYSQQQLSVLRREWARLDRLFSGVKYLKKAPDVIVVIDAHYDKIVVREAKAAKVPIIAIVDSNTDPRGIDYVIPANDDAIKSINLFAKYLADAILKGNEGKGVKHEFIDLSTVGIKEKDIKKEKRVGMKKSDKKVEVKKKTKSVKNVAKKRSTKKQTGMKKTAKAAKRKKTVKKVKK